MKVYLCSIVTSTFHFQFFVNSIPTHTLNLQLQRNIKFNSNPKVTYSVFLSYFHCSTYFTFWNTRIYSSSSYATRMAHAFHKRDFFSSIFQLNSSKMHYKSIVHIILLVIVMIIIMKWNEWMTYVKRTAFSFWLRFLSGDERLSKLQFSNDDDDYDDSWSLSFISPKKLNGYAFFFKNSIQTSCVFLEFIFKSCLAVVYIFYLEPFVSLN